MPFIPHTDDDVKQMLAAIGANSIAQLFDEIPAELHAPGLRNTPPQLSEQEVTRLMQDRAAQDGVPLCFLGAGAYEHHIPAAVWELVGRGEFYSAYTPYQAEASQGTLQIIYEYQSMISSLTGMAVSNASLYDGASALAEAALMAVRLNRKSKSRRILMPLTVNPAYRKTVRTIVASQDITLVEIPYCAEGGHTIPESLARFAGEDITALVIPQPNFFGTLEEVDALTDWARAQDAIVIAVVNPTALALLAPPGEWGTHGADIVCGEGQPLGLPLSWGGPYFGFMCCKEEHVRQMPGRIIGRTVDADGKRGFVLTLQAREQHIRRSKATSNICTNQGLMVTAATIYMSLLGAEGLERTALACHHNTQTLLKKLTAIKGVGTLFNRPYFHEAVIRLPWPAAEVLATLTEHGVLGGHDLGDDYPELGHALLINVTETKNDRDLERYASLLAGILSKTATATVEQALC
ncbi:MAG: glycine dehydrogenase (aminomethyl-transferring) [Gammaproteobacteria bacterium RBG_16_57_12]|nr:MAG: glycine dehydrogenase (aminomethyl-transferring) [Gammaproteobacteria bacterium RBG_16_57_12]